MYKSIKEILSNPKIDSKITIKGWIRTKRSNGKISFVEINDGSNIKGIQAIIDKEEIQFEAKKLKKLTTGTSISLTGILILSPSKGQTYEIKTTNFTIIGETDQETYPLQKKRHTFEFLREIPHLRIRTNTFGAVARIRNQISYKIHEYFQKNGFLYIHTPIITSNDGEGAGEIFRVSTLNFNNIAKEKEVNFKDDFFGKQAFLTVTGQLHGEAYAMALSKIYTFGPTFRAENSNTTRHASEFWMIEPEMAFFKLEDNINLAENFLKYILRETLNNCSQDMEFFDNFIEKGLIKKIENVINSEFEIITYTQAIKKLESATRTFEIKPYWGMDLQTEHERYLTEEIIKKPTTIIDYPKEFKAFYMKINEDNKTVKGMDILVPRIGEIIGGSEREDNLDKLNKRIKELNLESETLNWYLDLRRFGSTPHSGFGLGLERLIQYTTGMANIRDVIPFPRTPKTLYF
ncbi:Asparagine--tRNA ligase [Borrelia miyamotoi]|uniref:Asparagine--tRNA ligase n=1 Tax=Borrelia miyamotoi TaxID=47466 RepID=A0AAP9CGD3_9SPIR|nr:asparagine--tRNA ligase [Borrelia miyamotoi]AHH05317.1 Asparaginyl-tRNA synthetase [Borrelia miyamotoi FR64b]ATQ15078.1 asparagine--tRNA ligase [Borrelia miyamotoi]ATQ16261.1 asparagine--tRNA ligase [Borrelia miyamotoi]ATQ17404.1 asparagine--tRNA ligase [Borrelia miyamotoi]ATQ18094.1 asparagine--tRNA ligase [Borrelia miyamotoi]